MKNSGEVEVKAGEECGCWWSSHVQEGERWRVLEELLDLQAARLSCGELFPRRECSVWGKEKMTIWRLWSFCCADSQLPDTLPECPWARHWRLNPVHFWSCWNCFINLVKLSNVFALFSVLNTEGYLFSSCFHGFVYRVAVWEKVQLPSLSFNNISDYTK